MKLKIEFSLPFPWFSEVKNGSAATAHVYDASSVSAVSHLLIDTKYLFFIYVCF